MPDYTSKQTVKTPWTDSMNQLADTVLRIHQVQQGMKAQAMQTERESLLNQVTQEQLRQAREQRAKEENIKKYLSEVPMTEQVSTSGVSKEQPRSIENIKGDVARAYLQAGDIEGFMKASKTDSVGASFIGYDNNGRPMFSFPREGVIKPGTQVGQQGPLQPKTQQKESPYNTFESAMLAKGMDKETIVKNWMEMNSKMNQAKYPAFTPVPDMPGYGYNRKTNTIEPMKLPKGITIEEVADKKVASKSYANLRKQYDMTKQVIEASRMDKETLLNASDNFERTNYPAPNKVITLAGEQLGTPEEQEKIGQFKIALLAFSRKYMRVVTGAARSVAELSISAQGTADDVLSRFDSWQVLKAKVNQAQKEIDNEEMGYQNGMTALKGIIGSKGGKGKLTDPAMARMYLQRANGDNVAARQLAAKDGWEF